jgi:septum formation protein
LSYFKARAVGEIVKDGWILAGDTITVCGGRIFGKPRDRNDARSILMTLSGTSHQVITAVTLLDMAGRRRLIQHDTTTVVMRQLSDYEIEAYLDMGEWEGKAGAYGIQDRGDVFVDRIEGSFTNVVGFPMELVARMLGQMGSAQSGLRRKK